MAAQAVLPPVGGPLPTLTVPQDLVAYSARMQAFIDEADAKEINKRSLITRAEVAEHALSLANRRMPANIIEGSGTTLKITVKVAGEVLPHAVEAVAKQSTKKFMGKVVPIVSLGCGVTMAITRISRGDRWYLVVGEIVSGIAGCFPGWGTATSIALDAAMIGADVYISKSAPSAGERAISSSIKNAYAWLGIDLATNPNPTKDEVDHCYRRVCLAYSPDVGE